MLFHDFQDLFDHTVRVLHHIVIPEANDPVIQVLKPNRTLGFFTLPKGGLPAIPPSPLINDSIAFDQAVDSGGARAARESM